MGRAHGPAFLLACMACGWPFAAAEAAEDFYKGKTLTIITSEGPGGGSYGYADLVAQNIGRYLPGNPTVIIQAMPGASGLIATNHIYQSAARDGTVVGMPLTTALFAPIFGDPGARYKSNDFSWIGNLDQATDTCVYWKASGVTGLDYLMHHEVTFAASGPAGVGSQLPRAMNALIGTHAKVIHGYQGTGNMQVAMQRGEIQASCTYMLSALTSTMKTYYESGQLVPFIQFAYKSDKLPNVPHILDFAKTNEDKDVFKLIFQRDIVGRAIVGPPKIPEPRVKELRAAFDAVVKDPAFLADADKRGLPIDPLSGEQDDAFVEQLMAIPAAAVQRANAVLASGLGGDEASQAPSKAPAHP